MSMLWKTMVDIEDNYWYKDHCQSQKSFTTNIVDGIRVMGVHTHRMESHTTKKTSKYHKRVN